MPKLTDVKALDNKRLYVKYSNGLEGEISLNSLMKREEYSALQNIDKFEDVYIDSVSGDIIINNKIELCKNAVYGILDLKKQMERIGLIIGDE